MTNKEKYDYVFCETLQVEHEQLKNLHIKQTMLWDSIGHMTLIAALEEAFDIMLGPEEIMELTGLKPSKELGELVDNLQEEQFNGNINTKEEAVSFVKSYVSDL